jgi:ABC-type Zn uptake system ZnuABC Zn-binding protein ZnuA
MLFVNFCNLLLLITIKLCKYIHQQPQNADFFSNNTKIQLKDLKSSKFNQHEKIATLPSTPQFVITCVVVLTYFTQISH